MSGKGQPPSPPTGHCLAAIPCKHPSLLCVRVHSPALFPAQAELVEAPWAMTAASTLASSCRGLRQAQPERWDGGGGNSGVCNAFNRQNEAHHRHASLKVTLAWVGWKWVWPGVDTPSPTLPLTRGENWRCAAGNQIPSDAQVGDWRATQMSRVQGNHFPARRRQKSSANSPVRPPSSRPLPACGTPPVAGRGSLRLRR